MKMGEVTPTTLAVRITVDPADLPTFLDALHEVHNETKKLAELLYFDISGSPEDPGTFHLVETWAKDLQYLLNVEFKKPYYMAYYAKTDHLLKDRRVEVYKQMPGWVVNHSKPTSIG